MLRGSKIEAIAEWHLSMATIFGFICYHVHVAGWLRKWPKRAIGSISSAGPGVWNVRKSLDNMNIQWYRHMSGKKGMEFSVLKIYDRPPPDQSGAAANFGNSAHRKIWWPNVNNNIHFLTHEYSSTGFELRLIFRIVKFGEPEVEILPF